MIRSELISIRIMTIFRSNTGVFIGRGFSSGEDVFLCPDISSLYIRGTFIFKLQAFVFNFETSIFKFRPLVFNFGVFFNSQNKSLHPGTHF
jgi:hypothetical protein